MIHTATLTQTCKHGTCSYQVTTDGEHTSYRIAMVNSRGHKQHIVTKSKAFAKTVYHEYLAEVGPAGKGQLITPLQLHQLALQSQN